MKCIIDKKIRLNEDKETEFFSLGKEKSYDCGF